MERPIKSSGDYKCHDGFSIKLMRDIYWKTDCVPDISMEFIGEREKEDVVTAT